MIFPLFSNVSGPHLAIGPTGEQPNAPQMSTSSTRPLEPPRIFSGRHGRKEEAGRREDAAGEVDPCYGLTSSDP